MSHKLQVANGSRQRHNGRKRPLHLWGHCVCASWWRHAMLGDTRAYRWNLCCHDAARGAHIHCGLHDKCFVSGLALFIIYLLFIFHLFKDMCYIELLGFSENVYSIFSLKRLYIKKKNNKFHAHTHQCCNFKVFFSKK